uniref:Uncharacterized protein n=1 Tax=Monodelphis domestica TaxID=13616 RepID=A0A5F8GAK7_MONDO
MLLEHRTLCCCFRGIGQMLQIECLRSWVEIGPAPISLLPPTLKSIVLDTSLSGNLDLNYGPLVASPKELNFLSYWGYFPIKNSAVFISFPQSQGRLVKSC